MNIFINSSGRNTTSKVGGGAENNWGIIKKLFRKSKLCILKMQKIYEPNKSNWIVTKIKNKKVYKSDNESGVPVENIRIIVCLKIINLIP